MVEFARPLLESVSETEQKQRFSACLEQLKDRIRMRGDLAYVSVQKQLEIVEQLASFELGVSLLQERLLTGQNTDYIINSKNQQLTGLCWVEDFLLKKAPLAKATQQRFIHFQKAMQPLVREGICMASVPCGVMRDLLTLDFSSVREYSLIGIDIDPHALELARDLSIAQGIASQVQLFNKDVWDFDFDGKFDVITSNGLTIYEPLDEKVVELLNLFYRGLKPGGTLVISSITFPPGFPVTSEWILDLFSKEDLLMQKIILADILEAKWQAYRSTAQMQSLLEQADFKSCQWIYDDAHLFPTFVAKKPIYTNDEK